MDVVEATREYERWLRRRLKHLIAADLEYKHEQMASDAFSFLRGTFYRWAQVWPDLCADLTAAPTVLGIGDLHVENFGTWRDREGRLVWGINDFDEAATLPYTNDLVRLGTSALLAIEESSLQTPPQRACEAVLEGYTEALAKGGMPVVLAEHHRWLRDVAVGRLKEQRAYWENMKLRTLSRAPSARERGLLERAMPESGLEYEIGHRRAGMGSLGRQRFTAKVRWRGGTIAREAKPLTTSAWWWLRDGQAQPVQYEQIIGRALRVADPCLQVSKSWVVRRLAPDCSRVEIQHLTGIYDERRLLWSMGWETANVHLGSNRQLQAIKRDLRKRKGNWLGKAARRMRDATVADHRAWRKAWRSRPERLDFHAN
jgi:Uncharacterized protein conserved in bacteria (DUF2252)